jgi:hypothetical protein
MRIVGPPALAGSVLPLTSGRQLVGRAAGADLRIDDPHVSARHAVITAVGDRVRVEDLGSSNGTWLGGERITGTRMLHAGDIVTFGRVEARVEERQAPPTVLLPRARTDRRSPPRANFDVGDQRAHQINNVGGNQYNSYQRQRESFLREVAASKTKARLVFWLGLSMVIIGGLGYAYFIVSGIGELNTSIQTGVEPDGVPFFGPDTAVGPAGLVFFMTAFVGQFVLVIGLIMWIVAAARVRRVDTDPRYAWNAPQRS